VSRKFGRRIFAAMCGFATNLNGSIDELTRESTGFRRIDVVEICPSLESSLCDRAEAAGFTTVRLNHRSGFDLATTDGTQRAVELAKKHRFRKAWVSIPGLMRRPFPDSCVNDSRQEHNHQRAKQRSHAMARNILAVCREVVSGGGHVYWEWPPRACGWSWLEPFRAWTEKQGHTAHNIRIDGCAVGLRTEIWQVVSGRF